MSIDDEFLSQYPCMDEAKSEGMLIHPANSKIRQIANDSFSVLEKERLFTMGEQYAFTSVTNRMWKLAAEGKIRPEDTYG